MSDILAKILEQKRVETANLEHTELRSQALSTQIAADFYSAIRRGAGQPVRLIAELKRASPSKGLLVPNLNLLEVGQVYQANGAAAISVLTDEKFFQGHLDTLRQLRHTAGIHLPLLRKDFIIEETQLYEARIFGASAALLIVAALPPKRLQELHDCAIEIGLTPLVEVHDEVELETALRINGIMAIGVNNRNLRTFEVSLQTTLRLLPKMPADIARVAESGIFTAFDVAELADAGIDAILVGEGIITSNDIAAKVRELSRVGGKASS